MFLKSLNIVSLLIFNFQLMRNGREKWQKKGARRNNAINYKFYFLIISFCLAGENWKSSSFTWLISEIYACILKGYYDIIL